MMHKTQVFIRDDQYEILQTLAQVSGKKQSALIREGIDLIIKQIQKKQLWKERLMALLALFRSTKLKKCC